MSEQPERHPPQSVVQATGQVASEVVSGLRQQPLLLGVVVLNLVGIAAAVWFLQLLVKHSAQRAAQDAERLTQILKACLPHAAP